MRIHRPKDLGGYMFAVSMLFVPVTQWLPPWTEFLALAFMLVSLVIFGYEVQRDRDNNPPKDPASPS